ncbi:MAG TPA: HAD-IA family hydrolase [Candidatus Paceibacterota bacterium]|jgi:putative hydrolase of the HAD superfamily
MIKAALFDVDGVILVGRECLFSERLAKHQDIPGAHVSEFFAKDFKKCSFGKADLKEVLTPYLSKWKWKGSVDDLCSFWFENEGIIDAELLAIVTKLRGSGIKCYVATRQEKYRLKYLVDSLGLKNHFDGVFSTCDVGFDKDTFEFYENIFHQTGLAPDEILFFDDKEVNVKTARSLGIRACFYQGIEDLKVQAEPILSEVTADTSD